MGFSLQTQNKNHVPNKLLHCIVLLIESTTGDRFPLNDYAIGFQPHESKVSLQISLSKMQCLLLHVRINKALLENDYSVG